MTTPELALERVRTLRDFAKGRARCPPATARRSSSPRREGAREALTLLLEALSIVSVRLAEAARSIVADAQRRYERAKKARAGVDYADLMRLLRDGLRERASLRREWKSRYDAVLVDEFQDTNRVQRDLLYLLRERRDTERLLAPGQSLSAAELEPTGLLVVGDAKQSIYAFRGAEVAVFLATEQELAEAGGERLELTDSFRAVDRVLDAINPVTEALLTGGEVHATGMYDRRPRHARRHGRGRRRDARRARARPRGEGRRAAARRGRGHRPAHHRARHPSGEHRRLAPAAHGRDRGAGPLVVAPGAHQAGLAGARRSPSRLRGGPGFWDRREVDDLIVLLRFVAWPSDRLSLAALLRGPLVGLSDAGLAHLFAESAGLDDLLDPPASLRASLDVDDRERLDEARTALRRLVRFGPTLGPHGVLRQCLAERGYAAVLAALPFGAQRVANVDKLLGIAAAAEQRGGDEADLAGFVRYVDRMRDAAQRESEADVEDAVTGSVNVMSIHAAKGLEWPVVFVAQTSHRGVPRVDRVLLDERGRLVALPGGVEVPDGFRDLRKRAHAAEEDDARRLLYVALTRARDLLVVTGPDGDGDGSWSVLRNALRAESPWRVRVIEPAAAGPSVAVRARTESVDDDLAPEREARARRPWSPRGGGSRWPPSTVQDVAWCARRFHVLHDLGLREHTGAWSEAAAAREVVRRVLAQTPDGRARGRPRRLPRAGLRAAGEHRTAPWPSARGGPAALRDLAAGQGAGGGPGARGGRLAAVGAAADRGALDVSVTGHADLVVRGDAVGRDGLVVVRVTTLPDRDERALPGADPELDLLLACVALARRFAAQGQRVPVTPAVLPLGEESRGELPYVHHVGALAVEVRAMEAVRAMLQAREAGRWEARPRYVCDGLRCGFVARCHG